MKLKRINRWCSVALQISYLVLMLYVLTLLYPFFTGEFKVIPPSYKDIKYYTSNNFLTIEAPVIIHNGGLYEITDLHIETIIRNSTFVFANTSKNYGSIKSFETKKISLYVQIDFGRIAVAEANSGYYHIYNYDNLDFILYVDCKYGLDIVRVKITYKKEYLWTPLIKYIKVDYENSTINFSNMSIKIKVPFTIETSRILRGNSYINVSIYNASRVLLGNGSSVVVLGTRYCGFVDILIFNYTHLQNEKMIILKLVIDIIGIRIVHEYLYRIGDIDAL